MASTTLYVPPTQNALQYTLDAQLAAGGTSLTLNQSVASIVQAPGVLVIDRVDSSGNSTATKREYISFTGVSGANLTGLARGLAGSTDQVHSVGAVVEFVPDVIQQQSFYDAIVKEHSVLGQHYSLASTGQIRALDIVGWSSASLNVVDVRQLAVASLASIQQLYVTNHANFSGASVVGVYPSSASGGVLTSVGNGAYPVFAPPSASGTGGFNALFQVPGGLASQANVGGLVPVPTAFTIGFAQAFVQTPASVASVSATILKNNAVVGVVGILAGGTFASSASFSNTALVAGDELRLNINSTASLAADLSVLLRAT